MNAMEFVIEELIGGAVELILEFVIKPILRFLKRLIRHDL